MVTAISLQLWHPQVSPVLRNLFARTSVAFHSIRQVTIILSSSRMKYMPLVTVRVCLIDFMKKCMEICQKVLNLFHPTVSMSLTKRKFDSQPQHGARVVWRRVPARNQQRI